MKISRRKLISQILGTAGLYPLLPSPLMAQENDDHFFIFVELKGGAHHLLSTDYPDPDALAKIEKQYPLAVMRFFPDRYKGGFLTDQELSDAHKNLIMGGYSANNIAFALNGYCTVLPQFDGDNFKIGTTHNGKYHYRLGWSGLPLAGHVDEISVLRGVYMLGDFHGDANREIYSGHTDGEGPHVAGVLAKLLAKKYGNKPFDNLVLDGAAYTSTDKSKAAIKLPFSALNAAIEGAGNSSGGLPFSHLQTIARSLLKQSNLEISSGSKTRIDQYINAMQEAATVKKNLWDVGVGQGDISLNLRVQLDSCLELIRSGMSRVVTVCMGQKNATNEVDPFGLFDSHVGLYHAVDGFSSSLHHQTLQGSMQAIADFLQEFKETNPSLYRKTTVVISSEFSRPANFIGNEDGPVQGEEYKGRLGNGHYYFNNNYILAGKGVAGGTWLGESDPITRFPFCVDFSRLNGGDVEDAFIDPIAPNSRSTERGGVLRLRSGFKAGSLTYGSGQTTLEVLREVDIFNNLPTGRRAFMAKDVVRTLMAVAGLENEFDTHYPAEFYRDAHVIAPLLAKR